METGSFFRAIRQATLADIVQWSQAEIPADTPQTILERPVKSCQPLQSAKEGDLAFFDNTRYIQELKTTQAGACFVRPRHRAEVPESTLALVVSHPLKAMGIVLRHFYPDALHIAPVLPKTPLSDSFVHPSAHLAPGVHLDPCVVIGEGCRIGENTTIGAHSVIGPSVEIGRDVSIGPHVSISHAILGDRVIIHTGVRIGQDGFSFALEGGGQGHIKIPQIGRVLIGDDVEIGANTTVDRGANRDTMIGNGTKIDNLVQIAHNVIIGQHCIIVSQVGISGSCTVEDYVLIGGQAGLAGHLHIGKGAQIAAASGVSKNIPAGERWGGMPARPIRDWWRSLALAKKQPK